MLGHSGKLKIRQHMRTVLAPTVPPEGLDIGADLFARGPAGADSALTVELSIDGHPISCLLQRIAFQIDAEKLMPILSLTIIPTDVELDMDADMVRLLPPEVLRVYCLTKGNVTMYGRKLEGPFCAEKLIEEYRNAFPANQRTGSDPSHVPGPLPGATDPLPG